MISFVRRVMENKEQNLVRIQIMRMLRLLPVIRSKNKGKVKF